MKNENCLVMINALGKWSLRNRRATNSHLSSAKRINHHQAIFIFHPEL
jgi:hypothetical protein